MKKLLSYKIVVLVALLAFFSLLIFVMIPDDQIDYNSQVKPILNKHCITCHGGVKQSGGFSLLFENEAKGATDSGNPAIIPGHPDKSEMIRRLNSNDPEERMPYEKEALTKAEINILSRWIEEGAEWDIHWSYMPVEKTDAGDQFSNVPQFKNWAKNDIDYFIYERLVEINLSPSDQADAEVLARRLSLDLIGLPVTKFVAGEINETHDPVDPEVYIDQLLASPHFGEKWAGMWMDLARYADTKGYERDDARTIWKYRDWLIKAFNEDKPYNQFLTEQLAGDLIPHATEDQLIATAFHRNTMTNDEGGTDNEEFRVAAVIDRVNTTWEVTMGTTFSCVQCHSHPYDPFTMKEYYEFMAFFNNTRDEDTYDDYPVFRHFEGEDSVRFESLKAWLDNAAEEDEGREILTFVKTWQPSINSLTSDQFVNSELADTKWLVFRNDGSSRLKNVDLSGKSKLIYRYRNLETGGTWSIRLDSLSGPLLTTVKPKDSKRRWAYDYINLRKAEGVHDLYFTYHNPNLKNPLSNALMFDWFYFTEEFPGKEHPGYDEARQNFKQLVEVGTLQTPVMVENPPEMARTTRVFERGDWLSPTEEVQPGVPEIMNALSGAVGADRLDMAHWLVDVNNPLTARTYVNRIWEQLFGFGIVETLDDFGSQGIPPTHQDLLDHLAWKFMHDFQWSTKALIKYIVSSATYQQSSRSYPEQLNIDPQNRYYSHGPRIRLTAEQVRDQALVVSGSFNPKMYGPSVMPYQPEGIWNSPYNGRKWIRSDGEDQYRRAIYTYWKRTGAYPSMLIFDAMAREVCTSRRISTNTPLQALVTLNDSVYVEAAVQFAQRMLEEGGSQVADQIQYGYQLMMNKEIFPEKLEVLLHLYDEVSEQSLMKVASFTNAPQPGEMPQKSMIILANTMLNLDEFLMKN